MKKALVLLFTGLLITLGSVSYAADSAVSDWASSLKNAVMQDIQTTTTTTMNQVKLANYKKQLESKKQELADLEASNTNGFIKWFKRISLNNKISELEANIAAIENATKTTTETTTETK